MKITDLVTGFALPIVEGFGCRLWDVEYVREGSERYLRLYLDKDGGVDIEDCEKIHRAMDPILDEKDPIPESYHFEVCSAGLERTLKRPGDFLQFMDSPITVKLYRPRNGLKRSPAFCGVMKRAVSPWRPARKQSLSKNPRSHWCGSGWNSKLYILTHQ